MNPFDNENHRFYALRNEEGQHSLWPTFAAVPAGWQIATEGTRAEVVEYVTKTWTDMRPLSLVHAMESASVPVDEKEDAQLLQAV